MESLGVTLGLLWGHFGATLKLLGGTWGALGDHWELGGAFSGVFWALKVVWRRCIGAYEGHCGSLERYGLHFAATLTSLWDHFRLILRLLTVTLG